MTQPQDPYKQPLNYSKVKPLPPNWQKPILPGQWDHLANNGFVKQPQPIDTNIVMGVARWYLYFIPGIACFALILCVFFPWVSLNFLGSSISVNGVGGTNSNLPTSQNNSFVAHDGFIVLAAAVIGTILSLGGLLQRHKGYTIGLIIIGLVALGVFGYEFWNISKTIGEANDLIASSSTPNTFGVGLAIGFGIYLGLVMALTLIISSIVTYTMFRPKPILDIVNG
jgi:hypothetical protein